MKRLATGRSFASLAVSSIVCLASYYTLTTYNHNTYYDFLLWNLFLAWIPYLLSSAAVLLWKYPFAPRALFAFLGLLWLLFFPNAPYILTDFIHLTLLKHTYLDSDVKLGLSFSYWYDLIIIAMFAWNGLILGFVSLYQWHSLLYKRRPPWLSWAVVALCCGLTAYGILLGRIYRLNSWDMLTQPKLILESASASLTLDSVLFCGLLGVLILAVYTMIYVLLQSTASEGSR